MLASTGINLSLLTSMSTCTAVLLDVVFDVSTWHCAGFATQDSM